MKRSENNSVASLDSSVPGTADGWRAKPSLAMSYSKAHAVKAVKTETKLLTDPKLITTINRVDKPLRVDPERLHFDNLTPGKVYVMNFSIRNTTTTAQRIRLNQPRTGVFALNYIPSGSVAPGLDVIAEVQCCVPAGSPDFVFEDELVASMGPHRVEIPLLARIPAPNFSFNPVLELGPVIEGQTSSGTVFFENLGSVVGTVTLELDPSSKLSVSPTSLKLNPARQGNNRGSFNIKFIGSDLGPFREIIKVVGTGIVEPMSLDVSAQVVVQNLTLLSASTGALLEKAEFGTLIFGQKKSILASLVNNSPLPVTYNIKVIEDVGEGTSVTADGAGTSDDPATLSQEIIHAIKLEPSEGSIEPYAQVALKMTFSPVLPKPAKGFMGSLLKDLQDENVTSLAFSIQSPEADQTISVLAEGIAVLPKITVTPQVLRFGTCPLLDRRDILVTLTNSSPLSVPFEFSRVPHFKINPPSGNLEPQQSVSVVASFTPAQLGKFKVVSMCNIGRGLRNLEIRLIGDAEPSNIKKELVGGINALPDSFKPSLKFVDPETIKGTTQGTFKRIQPWEAIDFQQTNSSSQIVYEQSKSVLTGVGTANLDKIQDIQKKVQNRETYNSFLKNAHTKRLQDKRNALNQSLRARGVNLRFDPDGVDLGMDIGLDEPEPEIVPANEPLWTMEGSSKGKESSEGKNAGQGFFSDENRLITKKFKEAPVTQADMKDCAVELTQESLRSVQASHKVINFGRVSVNSVNVKNFSVSNQLLSMILVRMGTLEQELRQTKPLSQAIPGSSIAGFDLTLCCKEACKYKKTFTWIINEHHLFKVTVLAEVVPTELNMDRKTMTLEFPASSLDAFISDNLTLTNPGNAPAEFVWGNEGAFECVPEKGVIQPGESTSVVVVWTPNVAHRNEANLGLRIAGGADESLAVTGIFIDAKAAFDEKRVSLGTFAVGIERKTVTHLRNTGTAPIVFFIEDLPEQLNMNVSPKKGSINPGEVAEILIIVSPRSPVSFEGRSLVVLIRGGKAASIKLTGEAVVPQVRLTEGSHLQFGGVVVGSDCKLGFSLQNTGAIRAAVIFDLTQFKDFVVMSDSDDFSELGTIKSGALPANNNFLLEPITRHALSVANNTVSGGNTPAKVGAPIEDGIGAWRLTISPGATFNGCILFSPSKPKHYSFPMAVYLQGRPHEGDIRCDIKAEGLASRLNVSAFSVDFGDKIVNRDSSVIVSYFQEVVFRNVDRTSGLTYEIRETPAVLADGIDGSSIMKPPEEELRPVYFISPTRGDLSPGEQMTVRLTFMPPTSGEFLKKLYIYVEGQADPVRPYFILTCRGSGVFPRLNFSKESIALPTVPLGVVSRTSFTVFNSGYDNLELKYRISPSVPVPLEIIFPEGKELGMTVSKLKVIVSTRYEASVSWTGKIEFYDDDGEHFFLDICGCGDGSLISNYSFVKDYGDRFGYIALDGKPVQFLSKKDMVAVRAREMKVKLAKDAAQKAVPDANGKMPPAEVIPPLPASEEGIDIEREAIRVASHPAGVAAGMTTEADLVFLLKWLNSFIVRRQIDPTNFLNLALETNGDIVIDAIEQMSGRKITGLKEAAPPPHIRTSAQSSRGATGDDTNDAADVGISSKKKQLREQLFKYKAMLEFVVKFGGLLMHINPRSLLSLEDYVSASEDELRRREGDRLTNVFFKERKKIWQQEWLGLCRSGWYEVIFQAFKVFVLYRTSFAEYCATPGVVPPPMPIEPVAADSKNGKKKEKEGKKSKGPKIPPEFVPSNVYSTAEALLLSWAVSHIQKGARLSNENVVGGGAQYQSIVPRRIVDLDSDLGDFYGLLHILYSHCPDLARDKAPLASYSSADVDHTKDAHFKRLMSVMKQLQLDFPIEPHELSGSSRCFMILVMHLFLNLPALIPKGTVDFKGCLGTSKPIVKAIELRNPSNRRVTYKIYLDGSNEFSVADNSVALEPMSAVDVLVYCNPRFSKPAKAVITFRGIRDSGFSGSTMVFNLVSSITEIKPMEVHTRNVALFEMDIIKITITNPFNSDSLFPISLSCKSVPTTVQQLLPSGSASKPSAGEASMTSLLRNTNGGEPAESQKDDGILDGMKVFQEPFWVVEQSLNLSAKGSATLTVFALPFQLGTHTAQIILNDPLVGEFAHEIQLTVGLPHSLEKLSVSLPKSDSGGSAQYLIRLASTNLNFDRALLQATEARVPSNKRNKARMYIQNLIAANVDENVGGCPFLTDIASPYFTARKDLNIYTGYVVMPGAPALAGGQARPAAVGGAGSGGGKRINTYPKSVMEVLKAGDQRPKAEDLEGSILVSFSPNKSGVYKSKVLVYGKENGYDIRVIEITANVTPSETALLLEFHGAARQQLTQNITLNNDTDSDWNLVSNCTGRAFSAPKSIFVGKRDIVDMKVVFCAPISGTSDGTLALRNSSNGDSFIYKLRGVADEPLAEDTLQFKCNARNRSNFSIPIFALQVEKERSQEAEHFQVLQVETDLMYVSGSPEVRVPVGEAAGNSSYTLSVFSPVSGTMTGSITFKDAKSGQILWYSVVIEVTAPLPERSITLSAPVRKIVAAEISLENPTRGELEFQVFITGDGLLGESTYKLSSSLAANNTPYELIYSPLVTGSSEGSVSFKNEKVGEFWYKVNLTALPAERTIIPLIECMLGQIQSVQVPIENPLAEAVVISSVVEDSRHFTVSPDSLTLSPYSQSTFDIVFHPSNLSDIARSVITLTNTLLGEIVYEVSGKGLLPGVMPSVSLMSPMNQIASKTISFRNPFSHPLPLDVILTGVKEEIKVSSPKGSIVPAADLDSPRPAPAFGLLLRKPTGLVIAPESVLQVGISFLPEKLGKYSAAVELRATMPGRNLTWCYPLEGMAEAGAPILLPKLSTPVKTSLVRDVQIPLTGLIKADVTARGAPDLTEADFSIEQIIKSDMHSQIARCFRVQFLEILPLVGAAQNTKDGKAEYALRYRLLFEPLRELHSDVELGIICKNRGRWRADIELEAVEPQPDDVIRLVAPVGGSDKVAFSLSNRFLGYSPFTAFFGPKSSPHFSIFPTSGVLAPHGSQGTQFVVTFAPKGYGIREKASLVIQTEEAQWVYDVNGTFPDVKIDSSLIKSKLNIGR